MRIEATIAMRFLRHSRGQTLMILVGIAVGVAVIVFVTALIQGLQSNVIERTLGTQAHVSLLPSEQRNQPAPAAAGETALLRNDPRPQRLRSIDNWPAHVAAAEQLPGVRAVSPLVSGPALAQRGGASDSVVIMGVDMPRYRRIVPLHEHMLAGQARVAPDQVLIGNELAADLGLRPGGRMRLENGGGEAIVVEVAGIFSLGVRELDERYVYLDLRQAQALLGLPGGTTVIDVVVDDIFAADVLARQLGRLTGLKSESWMQRNAQLMNALRSQSLSTLLISVFVALSVAFGIASVLAVSVTQRTREIGILRAMGTRRAQMLGVFLLQGAWLGGVGALLGSLLGWALVQSFNDWGPGLFEVDVPLSLWVWSLGLAIVAGTLAALAPAWRAARLDPVVAIRHV